MPNRNGLQGCKENKSESFKVIKKHHFKPWIKWKMVPYTFNLKGWTKKRRVGPGGPEIVGYLWNWFNLQKNERRRQRACGPLITASGGDRVENAYFCVFADKQTHKQTKYAILPLQIDS